jgi:hypothetical protein
MSRKYIKAEIHLSSLQESAAYAANVLSFQLFFSLILPKPWSNGVFMRLLGSAHRFVDAFV